MPNDPASEVRRLAASLHAQDAATLLRSKLPFVLNALSPTDIAQIQRVLDARVAEPALDDQYAAATRRELAHEHAQGIYRDPQDGPVRYSREMRLINAEASYLGSAQYGIAIPIPYQKLLAPGALTSTAPDSPEAAFFLQIRQKLDRDGVTLHVAPTGQDPGPTAFAVWLSAGSGGPEIRTTDGRLTNDDLLEYWLRPIQGAYQALHAPLPKPQVPTAPDGVWFGLGAGEGGTLAVVGRDTMIGVMYSPDSYEDTFLLTMTHWRLGLGLGASAGGALIIATGGKTPYSFDGLAVGGWDFKAGLGSNWGAFAKGIAGLNLGAKIASTAGGLVAKSQLSVKEWQAAAVIVRDAVKGHKLADASGPAIAVMPIPLAGVALEASVYYAFGHCSVIVL
ncbi:MAG TPA: hypothetical protein VHD15_18950 [Hyphomicrobiales bacterium]|nr:hypothetical protein [Hyphomicrobiales bacterium]